MPLQSVPMDDLDDPVGASEIATRLGVQRPTVHKWRQRGLLPTAEYESVNGARAWRWSTILRWAGDSDRITDAKLVAEYRKLVKA